MEESGDKPHRNVNLVGRTARERLRYISRKPQAIAPQDVVAAFNGRPLSVAVERIPAKEVDRLMQTGRQE